MRKLKLFSVLMCLFIGIGQVWGDSETLTCSAGTVSNKQMSFSTTNFTFVHAKGTGNDPASYSPWRVYSGNTVTITAGSGISSIDKIEIVHSSTYYSTISASSGSVTMATSSGGTSTINNTTGTEVTLTITGSAQSRWSSIKVYYTISSGGGNSGFTPADQTFDLTTKTYTTGDNSVTWSNTYVNITNTTGSGTTSATNYLGGDSNNRTSSRFYGNNSLTITPASGYTISSVVFNATSANYATTLGNSTWTNASASVSGSAVTVTPTDGSSVMSATVGGTCGFSSIVVTFAASGSGSSNPTV